MILPLFAMDASFIRTLIVFDAEETVRTWNFGSNDGPRPATGFASMPGKFWNFQPPRSFWFRYGIAIRGSFFARPVARWGLSDLLGTRAPGAVFLLATLFSAVLAGLYPSVLTLLIGGIAAFNLFARSVPTSRRSAWRSAWDSTWRSAWRSSSTSKLRARLACCWSVRSPSIARPS